MRSLRQLLENYLIQYPKEINTKKAISFLKDKDCLLSNNFKGHFTASAWVLNKNRTKVLMTHHKQLNMWLQLGGHADGNSNLLNVALREAEEESGITEFKVITKEIFDLDIHSIPKYGNQPSHIHYDVRFIFEVDELKENIIISDESNDVSWISLKMAIEKNSEPSIERMVKKTIDNFLMK